MPTPSQRLIGLTGGIATGKTTVSHFLAHTYKLPVLDADIYAREAVKIGSPVLAEISRRYGQQILLANGALNRQALGAIIFQHPEERHWLEALVHPYVRQRFQTEMAILEAGTIVLAIPLLFEAKLTDLVTEIWVVSCPYEQQLGRLMKRDRLNLKQAQARINAQMPLKQKIAAADVVLDNSGTIEDLLHQVDSAI